ncbi:MAG: class I SAM-dependent methyltransferase [Proteobacteria bacterium]|nr:class I SAM-dependent methyltransferase [Pseudomonadota bacterium]
MIPSKEEVFQIYRKRARSYDKWVNFYRLLGARYAYRKRAVGALNLRRGDTVVEIGCGSGLNFPLLLRDVGSQGRIIGVDLTDYMLDQARKRVEREGWSNVELVQMDAAKYGFPPDVDGIISTFAVTYIPEYDLIIENGAKALKPGTRFVILDLKRPENWPFWLTRLGVRAMSPFGVTLELGERRPWESVSRYLTNPSLTEFYMGAVYISVGEKPFKNPISPLRKM